MLLGLIKKNPDITEVLKVEGIDLVPLPSEFAMRYPATLAGCARVWPHLHDTEGAFVARIRKLGETAWTRCDADNGSWIPAAESDPEADRARRHLRAHWNFERPARRVNSSRWTAATFAFSPAKQLPSSAIFHSTSGADADRPQPQGPLLPEPTSRHHVGRRNAGAVFGVDLAAGANSLPG